MAKSWPLLNVRPVAKGDYLSLRGKGQGLTEVNDGTLVVMAISPKVGKGKGRRKTSCLQVPQQNPPFAKEIHYQPLSMSSSVWVTGGSFHSPPGSSNLLVYDHGLVRLSPWLQPW